MTSRQEIRNTEGCRLKPGRCTPEPQLNKNSPLRENRESEKKARPPLIKLTRMVAAREALTAATTLRRPSVSDRDEVSWMKMTRWATIVTAMTMAVAVWDVAKAADKPAKEGPPTTGIVQAAPPSIADPCALAEVTANPTRPNWDNSASTTQCGVIETDHGWMEQPMGRGVRQQMLMTSMRYGLTPRLDLRWGLTSYMTQSGGGTASLAGTGDQWLSGRYRFHEQGRTMPALALIYGAKIPVANPAKGFGSGFTDHQFVLIASRDLGKIHLDFNTVGTVVGEAHGHDGSAQFGLALTRPLTKKFSWILESYGGPQPGTPDRFGAVFTGGTYVLRPRLVFDGAYARTYTAGSPREQVMFGCTYALRQRFAPLPRSWPAARFLGR
jgi:hypothetical protein